MKTIGQSGAVHAGGGHEHAGSVKAINADGTVDAWMFTPTGNDTQPRIAFVDIGEAPPTDGSGYFQAI